VTSRTKEIDADWEVRSREPKGAALRRGTCLTLEPSGTGGGLRRHGSTEEGVELGNPASQLINLMRKHHPKIRSVLMTVLEQRRANLLVGGFGGVAFISKTLCIIVDDLLTGIEKSNRGQKSVRTGLVKTVNINKASKNFDLWNLRKKNWKSIDFLKNWPVLPVYQTIFPVFSFPLLHL
jgi:hypothetical protein